MGRQRVCLQHHLLLALCVAGTHIASANLEYGPPKCNAAVLRNIAAGAGAGSFGVEGAAGTGGRAASVWDTFQQQPGAIADGATGDVAADFFHRYKADVALMKQLGLKHFRLSLSWSRLLPGARAGSAANPQAVAFYSSLLDELSAAGIQPLVALYHWDLPQILQDSYGGFTSPQIIPDFVHFADTAFRLFGSRVRTWLTFVEPYVVCNMQYGNGQYAPGMKFGDEGRYKCGHNVLLAHASAVQLYRQRYSAGQQGRISFSTLVTWPEPLTQSPGDAAAAQNKLDAEVGWWLDPVFLGDYPASLKQSKGHLLPLFTSQQQQLLRGSLDFIAANCFTAKWVSARPGSSSGWKESKTDASGKLIGAASGVPWINVVPWSQAKMLRYLSKRYSSSSSSSSGSSAKQIHNITAGESSREDGRVAILVSSSGVQVPGEEKQSLPGVLNDGFRISYYRAYLDSVCEAAAEGVKVVGWFAWSWLDGFEWTDGYRRKFGLVHVQYEGPQGSSPAAAAGNNSSLRRSPKQSALWLSEHMFKRSAT